MNRFFSRGQREFRVADELNAIITSFLFVRSAVRKRMKYQKERQNTTRDFYTGVARIVWDVVYAELARMIVVVDSSRLRQ